MKMHALIMGTISDPERDHKNGCTLDNRRDNLRPATKTLQARNRKRRSDSTTGYKGVSPSGKRFRVRICVNGKRITVGYTDIAIEGHELYKKAAVGHFGEFARFE
jgi:hypothetical protein